MSKSPITCHVLDASTGKPAAGVEVDLNLVSFTGQADLALAEGEMPHKLASGHTDKDGRCTTLLSPETSLPPGVYKIVFHTGPYFAATNTPTFYPYVEITFAYSDPKQHYHIPLLTGTADNPAAMCMLQVRGGTSGLVSATII